MYIGPQPSSPMSSPLPAPSSFIVGRHVLRLLGAIPAKIGRVVPHTLEMRVAAAEVAPVLSEPASARTRFLLSAALYPAARFLFLASSPARTKPVSTPDAAFLGHRLPPPQWQDNRIMSWPILRRTATTTTSAPTGVSVPRFSSRQRRRDENLRQQRTTWFGEVVRAR